MEVAMTLSPSTPVIIPCTKCSRTKYRRVVVAGRAAIDVDYDVIRNVVSVGIRGLQSY